MISFVIANNVIPFAVFPHYFTVVVLLMVCAFLPIAILVLFGD